MAESRQNKAFTLLEIMVALAILGASFTVLLAGHASAIRQEAQARRLMTATLLAREALTDTEIGDLLDLGNESGDFGEEFPEFTWEREVYTVVIPIETSFDLSTENLREVHIRVIWSERGEAQSTELVYYAFVEEP